MAWMRKFVFFFQDVGEQVSVGEVLLGSQFEVVVPMGQEVTQVQVFEEVGEFFSHGWS